MSETSQKNMFAGGEDWRCRAFLSLPSAAQVLGVSRTSLYKMANAGEVSLVRLGGRTLIRSEEVARLADGAEPWQPSQRAKKARAAKAGGPMGAGKGST
jgi:excisionase family DNA binding protein